MKRRGEVPIGYPPAAPAIPVLNGEQERLLLEHLPVVRFLARRIHERLPQHVDVEDLVSAGVVGLMDAFVKFDPAKKVQFRSYAQFRIRGAILDSLRTLDWSPRELRRKGRAVEEAIRTLTARFGRPPGDGEIATEMGLGLKEYQQLLGDLKGLEIGTLHVERNEESGEEELAYVPGSPEEDPLFRCLRGELQERLADAIANLPAKQIRFGGTLQLPSVRVPASAIEALEPGMLLRFDLLGTSQAEWRVGGQRIASAQAIRRGAYRAARIENTATETNA